MQKTNTSASVVRVVVASPLRRSFDYLLNSEQSVLARPGMRVCVPFGRQELIGMIIDTGVTPEIALEKIKPIKALIDDKPLLPPELLQLCRWVSDYYHHSLGEVIFAALPKWLREGREVTLPQLSHASSELSQNNQPLQLNHEQQQAVTAVMESQGFQTFLLAGVTGSGKTEVYLQIIAQKLQQGQQALVLVPEISLTPQTVSRFQQRFGELTVVMHSKLTDKQRLHAWQQAASGAARIVIGTRSAIFCVMPKLGVIILDEEHDGSFKQQSSVRYSARDVAVVRGQRHNIPVILGSATPCLETLYNVKRERYRRLNLIERAGIAKMPSIRTIDLRNKTLVEGLSDELLITMQQHLTQQGQVLLFLNRRGYAPMLMCHHCGWVAQCPRCDARFTLHLQPKQLICHHCETVKIPPRICEHCHQGELDVIGLGTERIEATLQKHFSHYNVIRIDRDSTSRKGSLELMLEKMHSGEAQILIGTQMIAKGHHFANLSLVAIVDADYGLFSADFRATERMAQLLLQVAGRAGRSGQEGEVLIQTHNPDHPLLTVLIKEGYDAFAEKVFSERKATALPPFSHLVMLRAEGKQREMVMHFLQEAKEFLLKQKIAGIKAMGPVPALMERKANKYRAQLLLQSSQRPLLQQLLTPLLEQVPEFAASKKVRWSLDVDPQDLM